jgi:dTDP-4-dehydrorhamnose reductase
LELWGGAECSHVRVGARIEDQQARTGHDRRLDDLDRFASLGLRALRLPVLWEHHAGPAPDWSFTAARLGRLRALGLRPIVGFLHHGSGPLPGGLLDPGFAVGLADFARRFAERFPWVEDYTPVNEPLTTARFAGLYGLWHPHGRDLGAFTRVLLNQCEGVRRAMRAVRMVNPRARLVQTEDVGRCHGTPLLGYQVALENERRWLSFDLLAGRLATGSPMGSYLRAGGASEAELGDFVAEPCVPDVFGMNHYVTSERHLDERLHLYPAAYHGGNGLHRYADLPAVRARAEPPLGWGRLLDELWARYRRPIAITEVQLACTREEQVRWLLEAWRGALGARERGADVRAVTAWALLGAYDWDSLLLYPRGSYETGAFDVRGPAPRPTALAAAVRSLAATGAYAHPAVDAAPGWWRRPLRLELAPSGRAGAEPPPRRGARPLLVLGARGTLGRAFVAICGICGLPVVALGRDQLDLDEPAALRGALARHDPWAVVNAAGYVRVDEAERDEAACLRANCEGPAALAAACVARRTPLAVFSSDLVFDGRAERPYLESSAPAPLGAYGRSKAAMERRVAEAHSAALIVRTSAFFGPWDGANFAFDVLRRLHAGEPVVAAADLRVSPTYVPDLVNAVFDLLIDGESGLWHLTNSGAVSWAEWAREIAGLGGFAPESVVSLPACELGFVAPRPRWSVLGTERGALLPGWRHSLRHWFLHVEKHVPRVGVAAAEGRAPV